MTDLINMDDYRHHIVVKHDGGASAVPVQAIMDAIKSGVICDDLIPVISAMMEDYLEAEGVIR